MKIVIIGAGAHSRGNHLPALARIATERTRMVTLAAVCDLKAEVACEAAREFGFGRFYTDIDEMLSAEKPDACVAVTPIPVTASVAAKVIDRGVPLLMEKPIGSNLQEGRDVVDRAKKSRVPVMVSLNRRFDPALRAAMAWLGDREIDAVHARMIRRNRRERRFFVDAGIHPVDTMREIGGEVTEHEVVDAGPPGARSITVLMRYQNRTRGHLEIYRQCGHEAEAYDVFGKGFHVNIRVGGRDMGEATAWQGGAKVLEFRTPQDEPVFSRNGTYDETCAFIDGVAQGRPLRPNPGDAYPTLEICHAIDRVLFEGSEME
jgi:predicted dehydrogenase